ncbi:unnamed protein product [marine sediment metagenome]|uniref:Uncharacterized protein n=1 Tax=marine sediment metagenome TaxID=412755 RepID=X0WHT4_9ZZZZ
MTYSRILPINRKPRKSIVPPRDLPDWTIMEEQLASGEWRIQAYSPMGEPVEVVCEDHDEAIQYCLNSCRAMKGKGYHNRKQ